jgi:hypothetical protein
MAIVVAVAEGGLVDDVVAGILPCLSAFVTMVLM